MASGLKVTIEGTEKFKAKIRNLKEACGSAEAKSIGRAGAQIIVSMAKTNVHVISGDLKNSIRVEDTNQPGIAQAVAGGVNGVNYAKDEEYGNSRRPAHPYMRPAVDASRSQVRAAMRQKAYRLIKKASQ